MSCWEPFRGCSLSYIVYELRGLSKTRLEVIEKELEICACLHDEEKLRQQLFATGIIYDVQFETQQERKIITLKEKWTTIPIFKINSGGGIKQYTLGVYDPNVLGQRIELGAQYESLGGAPSFVFWNEKPRLFGGRLFSDLQIWNTQRARLKYDQELKSPILRKAFLQKSERLYGAIGYEWDIDLRARLSLETQDDNFSLERLSNSVLEQVAGQSLPINTNVHLYGFQVEWGLLELFRQSPKGFQLNFQLKYGNVLTERVRDFLSSRVEILSYQHFDNWMWASRYQLGTTNTTILQFWNYLGGFESIRGYTDNRFATRDYWLMNQEVRHFIYESEKTILQGVAFLDSIGITEGSKRLENVNAASTGLGIRLILPQYYRVVVRLDLSQTIIKRDVETVNFGIQQFF